MDSKYLPTKYLLQSKKIVTSQWRNLRHLNQVKIISNETNLHHVPPDIMH